MLFQINDEAVISSYALICIGMHSNWVSNNSSAKSGDWSVIFVFITNFSDSLESPVFKQAIPLSLPLKMMSTNAKILNAHNLQFMAVFTIFIVGDNHTFQIISVWFILHLELLLLLPDSLTVTVRHLCFNCVLLWFCSYHLFSVHGS